MDKENSDRNNAENALNTRVDTEITDRENAISELRDRMNEANSNRDAKLDDLRKKLMRENLFLKSLAGKPLSVYFDAYRTKAYDGGGEENLTFQVKLPFHIVIKNRFYLSLKNRVNGISQKTI